MVSHKTLCTQITRSPASQLVPQAEDDPHCEVLGDQGHGCRGRRRRDTSLGTSANPSATPALLLLQLPTGKPTHAREPSANRLRPLLWGSPGTSLEDPSRQKVFPINTKALDALTRLPGAAHVSWPGERPFSLGFPVFNSLHLFKTYHFTCIYLPLHTYICTSHRHEPNLSVAGLCFTENLYPCRNLDAPSSAVNIPNA